jgi:hypothetical protein
MRDARRRFFLRRGEDDRGASGEERRARDERDERDRGPRARAVGLRIATWRLRDAEAPALTS